MKITRPLIAAGLLACAVSAASAVALADDCPGPPGYRMYDYGMERGMCYGRWLDEKPYSAMFGYRMSEGRDYYSYLADRLDLSDEQRKSVRDILEQTRTNARKLGESLRDNREQMHDSLEDKGYGPDFDRLAKKQGELIGQMITLRAKTRSQIMGVLTDGQKKDLKERREPHRHRDDYYDWWY